MTTDNKAWNQDALELATAHSAKAKFDYPLHGYGPLVERIVRPTEWNDAYDGFLCETEEGVKNFLLDKIVGPVLVKP